MTKHDRLRDKTLSTVNPRRLDTPSRSSSPTVSGKVSTAGLHPESEPLTSTSSLPYPPSQAGRQTGEGEKSQDNQPGFDHNEDPDAYEMADYSNMNGSHTRPLLSDDKYNRGHGSSDMSPSARPQTSQLATARIRSRDPKYAEPQDQMRRKYMFAGICLVIALISFVVQTETAVYIQHELHWNKAYCMLWLTHGSWSLLWPIQLLFLRISKRKQPWAGFWRRHKSMLRSTAQMVVNQDLYLNATKSARTPWPYIMKTTAYVTTFLTFAGASWYVAVDLTSPSDLTAIYNCSAFFAYVFSVILLKERVRLDKIISVALAVAGVLVVAYGDKDESSHPKTPGHSGGSTNPEPTSPPDNRLLGNLIIGVGSVLYGLYEVLYKKYACPPEGTSPTRGMVFANTFGSCIGMFTLCVLWIPLPILHFLGWERFELPHGKAALLLAISTLSNAVFSGAFLVLMSLTSPVLSSVASLLTIFLVAITDYFLTGKPLSAAAIIGGSLIIVAFLMLSWATYREIQEDARKRAADEASGAILEDADEDDEDEAMLDEGNLEPRRRSSVLIRGDEDGDWNDDSDAEEEIKITTPRRRHRQS